MKRILEKVDSNRVSRFIPQYKFLGLFWMGYEGYPCGNIEFDDFDKCRDWLIYERTVSKIVHSV